MRPDVVTFWHGPLDALRLTCLRSQVAAGHKVTVYSFDPLPGLPEGVGNAEAEAILPHAFSERLRPSTQDLEPWMPSLLPPARLSGRP